MTTLNITQQDVLNGVKKALDDQTSLLETLKDGISDRFQSLGEAAQEGEEGNTLQEIMESLQSAMDNINVALDDIAEALGSTEQ